MAAALRTATQRLQEAQLNAEERTRLTRRLLAITGASKHDLAAATRRLQDFLGELEAAVRPPKGPRTTRHKGHRRDGD